MNKERMLPADPDLAEHDEESADSFYDGPSKSQLKREAEALQHMGGQLAALSADQLKKIDMPDNLRAALREAQRITSNGAKRRQAQLIGKIMRSVDTAPLQEALDRIAGVSASAKAYQQRLEKLREHIMANDSAFAEIARDFPGADIQQLRQLRRNALKEAEQNKPPRAYRELFRQLRELVEAQESENDSSGETVPDEE